MRFRPRSEWARLAGSLAMTAVAAVLACWPSGWVLAHIADAFWGVR